jgi:SAM-dependent methyltransferase
MPSTTSQTPSATTAERWGAAWGARASDWAITEEQQRPAYEEVLRHVQLNRGQTVLDIGCGAGSFLSICVERGARPSGIDASEQLLELARRRVAEADIRLGDMQALPYDADSFDLVTGFTSFFFAEDMVEALREAGRVAKLGAPVVIQVFGPPERNDLEPMKKIARPFFPTAGERTDKPAPPSLWKPGVLEQMAEAAGLTPRETFDHSFAYEYADEESLGRLLLAPGGLGALVGPEREPAVRAQIVEAMAPFRTPDGGYRLSNELHYLIASAP